MTQSRLRHIGLGRAHAGEAVQLLIADDYVRVVRADGSLLRELVLDADRDYQPRLHSSTMSCERRPRCPERGQWRARQVLDARLQPIACQSRAAMSGSPRPADRHERRVPARRILGARDPAPDGCPRCICCCICLRRSPAAGHSTEHREAPPRGPACAVGSHHRAADLRRAGCRVAGRSESGAPLTSLAQIRPSYTSLTPTCASSLRSAPRRSSPR